VQSGFEAQSSNKHVQSGPHIVCAKTPLTGVANKQVSLASVGWDFAELV